MPEQEALEAAQLLSRWRVQLKDAQDEYELAAARIYGLRKMIEGLEIVHPELKPTPPTDAHATAESAAAKIVGSSKTVADHVRDILREQPNRWFASGEMVREVQARDETAEAPAIRLALSRTAGKISEKRGEGKGQSFRLKTELDEHNLVEV